MKQTVNVTAGASVRGVVQCHVIDARTKKVLRIFPKQKNLILNRYLNYWAGRLGTASTYGWQGGFYYACAGNSDAPTQIDSGITTAAQTGTTVTLSGGSFTFTDTATDSGKVIKWATAEEAMIVSVTSATEAEVSVSQTVSAGTFTVYLCHQSAMGGGTTAGVSDLKRTSSTVSGLCGTTWVSPQVVELKRTFDFTEESGSVTYKEIGMSNSNTLNSATLNVRVVLSPSITLEAGQQLRVVYTLIVTFSPAAPQTITADVPGWPVAPATSTGAKFAIETLSIIQVTETGSYQGGNPGFEPGRPQYCYLSPCTLPLLAAPTTSGTDRTTAGSEELNCAYEDYVSNSFECFTKCVFTPVKGDRTDYRSIFLGHRPVSYGYNPDNSYMRVLFDENQTKDNTHRLTVRFRWKASRTLS